MPSHVFAKAVPEGYLGDPARYTLPGHIRMVTRAAKAVLGCSAGHQLHVANLDPESYRNRLNRIVLLASALHDFGKANDHFQAMLVSRKKQALRHEWISIWLINQETWKRTIAEHLGNELDFAILWWTIAGHHPSYNHPMPPLQPNEGAPTEIKILGTHPDFIESVANVHDETGLMLPRPEILDLDCSHSGNVFPFIRELMIKASLIWEEFSSEMRLFATLCKACLPGCDALGSAAARKTGSPMLEEWINTSFRNCASSHDFNKIVEIKLNGKSPRKFQTEVAATKGRVTLVTAGCASGKTAAAYLWAASKAANCKLFFCYPTTGTATEGFRGYLFDEEAETGRLESRLFHGRAEVDIEIILNAREEDDPSEFLRRMDALNMWSTPIVVCTADAILGLVQNHIRSLYLWPPICNAGFVFDEIHEYDDSLFGALLRFLGEVKGVPVLLMTASLPRPRLDALKECLIHSWDDLSVIAGPEDMEMLPRYNILNPPPLDDFPEFIQNELSRQKKILWICNTVDRAMQFADQMENHSIVPILYHSRFKYEDRVLQHKKLIESFKGSDSVVAICTQVAQVSLDISADILITDIAPIPDLIQRLGRLNRWATPSRNGQAPATKPFMVIETKSELPYEVSTRAGGQCFPSTKAWLNKLGSRPLSQKDLSDTWEQDFGLPIAAASSAFFDGGPLTSVCELRKGTPGITVVLDEDTHTTGCSPVRIALPMPQPPRTFDWTKWKRYKGFPVVPNGYIHYDKNRGASWQKLKK